MPVCDDIVGTVSCTRLILREVKCSLPRFAPIIGIIKMRGAYGIGDALECQCQIGVIEVDWCGQRYRRLCTAFQTIVIPFCRLSIRERTFYSPAHSAVKTSCIKISGGLLLIFLPPLPLVFYAPKAYQDFVDPNSYSLIGRPASKITLLLKNIGLSLHR